jgi:hypothetical protein
VTNAKNTQRSPGGLAGASQPRPAEFPIGSMASRAAARMLAQEKRRPRTPPMAVIPVENLNDWLVLSEVSSRRGEHELSDYWIQFEWAGQESAAEIESAMLARKAEQDEDARKERCHDRADPYSLQAHGTGAGR